MGYTTQFDGSFKFSRKLTENRANTLRDFADDRHGGDMKEYEGMPGMYCQWIPSDDRKYLVWDEQEKFYSYVEWLVYLIKNYFEPWGIKLNGTMFYSGEEIKDSGIIVVRDNWVKKVTIEELAYTSLIIEY